tara:strand:- start:102 stop:698 length:597 start_codon:yes stop_codon:yes gene_type:complete
MIIHKKHILASSSKSRYRILKNIGFSFEVVKPLCNEEALKKELTKFSNKPALIAKKLSFEKAKSISVKQKYFTKDVIGCDTLVYYKDKIFDKAKNLADAKKKIRSLSGKTHKIVSGLTICKGGKILCQCSETTEVKIRKLTDAEIEQYLKKSGKQILQSVGCYQLELLGPNIIENIKGDFFNVMGLPLFKLLKHLSKK